MTRAVSAPTAAAASQTITQPGYLLQVGFSFVGRYSSRGDVNWNGLDWLAANLQVGELQEQPNGSTTLTVQVGNTDRAFGALCLNEPPQEKPVSVWAFYEGAIALGDPVQIFGGVIEDCDISEAAVTLRLSQSNQGTLVIPRKRITRDAGFNRLSPAGRVIEFDGVRYELVRA
jgi:hypothetical protein